MADVQVTSAELTDGVLTVSGSGFTKTTTQLFIDGVETPFDTAVDFDGTEVTVQTGQANTVWAVKGGVESEHVTVQQASPTPSEPEQSTSEPAGSAGPYDPGGDVHEEGYKTEDPNATPGDLVEDDLKTTSDTSPAEMNRIDSDRQASKEANQPDREPLKEGEHLPGKDFRFKVENTAAGDLGKTIGPRDPYPKDNPPDHREGFYRIHGYYPPDEGGGEQAAQMDADPKT